MLDYELLNKIKKAIRRDDEYKSVVYSNCYMYALKIDIESTKLFLDGNFRLGILSDTYKAIRSKDEMEYSLYRDLDALDIDIQKVEFTSLLNDNDEWKISLFRNPVIIQGYNDFHFIRQIMSDKDKWKSKHFFKPCKYVDKELRTKQEDGKVKALSFVSNLGIYDYVGTYKLKLK